MFTIRTTKPSNNKYYIRTVNGGYNGAIQGYPTDKTANVLSNCVGYANGRFGEIIGKDKIEYQLVCNAENFIEAAKKYGLTISNAPTLGGIMVWQKGSLSASDGAGHVAIVEKIIDINKIYTSESSYAGKAFFNATRTNTNGNWGQGSSYKFRGCIVNPAVKEGEIPSTTDPFPGITDEELAKRVWLGEFGSGETRKQKLGSRYAAVQALVNKGIGKPSSTDSAPPATPASSIQKGDTVRVIKAVTYGTNQPFTCWYPKYTVIDLPKGSSRAIIGVNGVITAAIDVKNLQKI